MFAGRLSALPPSSFAQLAALVDPHAPGATPVSLSVGDPQGVPPDFVLEALRGAAGDFGKYPPINATAAWRAAAGGWLRSRFGLPGAAIDDDKNLLPLNGTREGLFLALFTLMPKDTKAGGRPAVLIPNPFYQCYAAAAVAAGAEPVFVPATAETGFLPDYARLPRAVLDRAVAAFVCSPSNPEGACGDEDYWRTVFALADRHDFTVFADECYADIYRDTPPVSSMAMRFAGTGGLTRLLSFHSLSKRSGLPGLRSGIVAGDAGLIENFRFFRNYAGPQVALPIIAASAAAWNDEAHVEAQRARYNAAFDVARAHLGHLSGFRVPQGGFCLWLDVGNGEEAALRLWREGGIRVLPGAYMGRAHDAENPRTNPGFSYVRVALVSDLSTIGAALEKTVRILDPDTIAGMRLL